MAFFLTNYFVWGPARLVSSSLFAQQPKDMQVSICFVRFERIFQHLGSFVEKYRTIPQLCNLFCAFAQVCCVTGQVMKRWDSPQDARSQVCASASVFQSALVRFDRHSFQADARSTRSQLLWDMTFFFFCIFSSNSSFTFNSTRLTFSKTKLGTQSSDTYITMMWMRGYK